MDIGGLIKKEFGRIKSDKRTLILLFVIPVILVIILGLSTGGGPIKFFNSAIITRDSMPSYGDFTSNSSAHDGIFISIMRDNTTTFTLYNHYNSTNEDEYNEAFDSCIELLRNELIDVLVVLPENFSESVENTTNVALIYYIDGSDITAVTAIEVALQEPISLFRVEVDMMSNFTIFIPYLEFDVPFWEAQTLNFALALMLPLIILGTTMNLTSLSIVSEQPLPRMLLTPTAKNAIILSKVIANFLIMTLQVTLIFVITAFFGLYSLGSLSSVYLILLATGLCGVSIGLFISSLSPTEQVANQLYLMFFIVILIFSGAFIDPASLGPQLEMVVNILPLAHAIPLFRDVTLRGIPLDLESFGYLNLLSLIFISLSYIVYMFKKLEV